VFRIIDGFLPVIFTIFDKILIMIVVTGAAGFIGSVLTGRLNNDGLTDLALVDTKFYEMSPI